ncbi:MAG: hypothetical protein RLZZ15_3123 [Verrucomicrobiota bacterium]
MLADLRYALRTLAKSPWLSLVIVLSLALGIGANAVVFAWLNASLLRPLPAVPATILGLEARNAAGTYVATSWLELRNLAERLPALDGAVAAHRPRTFNLGEPERGERVWGEFVTGNFFPVLGVRPALGRFFRADETATPGGAPVAVVSFQFWQRQLGGDPTALGRTIKLNNRTVTVVGVAPEGFVGAFQNLAFDVWVPITLLSDLMPASRELTDRGIRSMLLFTVLPPGVTAARVEGELAAAARALAAAHPAESDGIRYELLPLWRNPRGGAVFNGLLALLQLFAGLILVVVCVNTANLLLARASTRTREIGIRLACGAGAGRVVRQLLTESVLLALAGAALGTLFALWGVDLLAAVPTPSNMPVKFSVALDWRALVFAAGVGVACGVLFGLAPALQLARADVQQALRGGRGAVGGRSRLRDVLVALEVGVALVVLVLAGLFLKFLRNARTIHPGFDREKILLASADLVGRGLAEPAMKNFMRDALARLAALPGVELAAAANTMPMDIRGVPKTPLTIDGAPRPPGDTAQIAYFRATPGYLALMRMPLVAGTDLAPLAQEARPLDAVINEEMARRFWPGRSPLGHKFHVESADYEVVGVVRDANLENFGERPQPAAWITSRGVPLTSPVLHVRVRAGDPRAVLPAVRAAILALDPELVLYDARAFTQHLDNNLFLQRAPMQLLGVLGPLALALAAIGLYAVLAFAVAQRTQEIGVRLTLGATPASVVALIVREGMKVVLVGAALGWVVAFALGWFLREKLVGVSALEPVVYAGVPALLLAVAALACWLPARRAAKVDPMAALRAE